MLVSHSTREQVPVHPPGQAGIHNVSRNVDILVGPDPAQ